MFDFLGTKKQPTLSKEQSLLGVPQINVGVAQEANPDGEPVLIIQREPYFMPSLLKRIGMTKMGPKQLILDPLGKSIVDAIDGNRNVKQLIKFFGENQNVHPKEAEKMVVSYLNELLKRQAISVVFK